MNQKKAILARNLESFDYYRPNTWKVDHFDPKNILYFIWTCGCQCILFRSSYFFTFGKPDDIHYDVRQLLGTGRMNDYFDLDLYYGTLKVSVKSSYFRVKSRPSFIVYGKRNKNIVKDRQG